MAPAKHVHHTSLILQINIVLSDIRALKSESIGENVKIAVAELLDDGALGEGIIPLTLAARKAYGSEVKVIPGVITVKAVLVSNATPIVAGVVGESS